MLMQRVKSGRGSRDRMLVVDEFGPDPPPVLRAQRAPAHSRLLFNFDTSVRGNGTSPIDPLGNRRVRDLEEPRQRGAASSDLTCCLDARPRYFVRAHAPDGKAMPNDMQAALPDSRSSPDY